MIKKRKIRGSILAIVGFILSPLSWWNDIFINIPLAYLFAIPFGLILEKLFIPAMILGYILTNVIGFVLMHHSVKYLVTKKTKKSAKKDLIKNIIISLLYTALVIGLILLGWIKFPTRYFQ